jgi:hypothetical protein
MDVIELVIQGVLVLITENMVVEMGVGMVGWTNFGITRVFFLQWV